MASSPQSDPVPHHPDQLHTDKMVQPAMAAMRSSLVTTSFLLSNMHCPSCVAHIKDVLFSLQPSPIAVSPSLLSSWVTVQHDDSLSVQDIATALEDAGFDIYDITAEHEHATTGMRSLDASRPEQFGVDGEIGYLDRFIDRFQPGTARSRSRSKQSTRHLQNCESCRREAAGKQIHAIDAKAPTSTISESTKPAETSKPNIAERTKPAGAMLSIDEQTGEYPLVAIDSKGSGTWRASIAVGGMTCASCAGAITKELEKKDWVRKVVVNLISNSATVDFIEEEHKNDICMSIEDIGFEATLDSVVDLEAAEKGPEHSIHRTVDILIQGMFCDNCPGRVIDSIETLAGRVKVEKPPTVRDPIMTILYTPQVPSFTIRNIVASIAEMNPAFKPTIYHPPTLEERSRKIHAREQLRILIRVALTLALAVPTLVIGIVYMSLVSENDPGRQFLMAPLKAGVSRAQWALFIMATPVYFLCADVFHVRALKEIRSMWRPGSKTPILQRFYRFGSMNMLMSLGTSIAYWSSVAQLIAAAVHPHEMVDNNSFYFDSVVLLTLFLLIGRLIESYSKSKTGDAITMLGKLRPTEALLVTSVTSDLNSAASDETLNNNHANGSEATKRVNVDLLEFGDIVKVLHGGSPPCDGTVIQGETKFDESSLTGESRLVKKAIGDEVFSGTVNKDAPVSIEITGVAGSSMLDQIVKAVREGQTKRAPMERIADTLTSYFVPFVTLIAITTWAVWLSLGLSGTLPYDYLGSETGGWVVWSLQFAIAVFVVACPCGLALAAPTAIFVGGGLAAKHGILVKGGGEAFEKASRLDCIVFDKTGTLTVGGEPVVTDFRRFPMVAESVKDEAEIEGRILGMVNAIEGNSSHTIAKALVSFCKERQMKARDVRIDVGNVEEVAGKGMKGTFHINATTEQMEMSIGNELLMSDSIVHISPSAQSTIDEWKSKGRSVALAALRSRTDKKEEDNRFSASAWQLAAAFAVSDPVRPEATGIIKALQKRGKDVWMLSGDNQITANAIGAQVGIPASNIIAGVLPSQKAEKIQYLQRSLKSRNSSGTEHSQNRALVAMVGDGINDSPALTTADVGIAIGSGSDIAISSAEFVLVSSNLNSLITLLDLSKFVFRRIKFNFGWALVYNLIALPVAAGALYPLKGGNGVHVKLDPVWASLAMAMSSISVVLSSLALRSKLPWIGFKVQKSVEETGRK
jgi:P-type Cu+ transporter